jgi:hypothetical protein
MVGKLAILTAGVIIGVTSGAYGPTLVAKVGNIPGGSVAWIGSDCNIAVVNTTILNPDLNQQIIAQTENECTEDVYVSALGISAGFQRCFFFLSF